MNLPSTSGLLLLLTLLAGNAGATTPLTLRAWLSSAEVTVGEAAILTVELDQAVPLAALDLPPPMLPLADVLPLGPPSREEVGGTGERLRRTRQQFLIVPFASGPLAITAQAQIHRSGAAGPETLAAERSLTVTAARAAPGIPASQLTLAETWTLPAVLHPGAVIARTVTLRAEGVRASRLLPPQAEPGDAALLRGVIQSVERHEQLGPEGLVSTLRVLLSYVPETAGTAALPALSLTWRPRSGPAETARLPGRTVTVATAAERPPRAPPPAAPIAPIAPPAAAPAPPLHLPAAGVLLILLALLLARAGSAWARTRPPALPRKPASARAAYAALEHWSRQALGQGLGPLAGTAEAPLPDLIAALDRAAFGPRACASDPPPNWPTLRRHLYRLARTRRRPHGNGASHGVRK